MELLEEIVENFGSRNVNDLVDYTHRKHTPWYITAEKEGLLTLFETSKITNTEILVDMESLVASDSRKAEIFREFQQQ